MFCTNCGSKQQGSEKFCKECGTKITGVEGATNVKAKPVATNEVAEDVVADGTHNVRTGFKFSNLFSGRLSRRNYWIMFLILYPFNMILTTMLEGNEALVIPVMIWVVLVIILSISMVVRRFHDLNLRGWWILLGWIPIFLFAVLLWNPQDKGNRWGEYPDRSFSLARIFGLIS
jgi:uncharacterized membrane protein YhaH (DUF805 family)